MSVEEFLRLVEAFLRAIVGFVADIPFQDAFDLMDVEFGDGTLPAGKGALILVFGGLFALASSLFLIMLSPRPAATGGTPRRSSAAMASFTAVPGPQGQGPVAQGRDWIDLLSEETRRCGFGQAELVASGKGIWRIRLAGCRSCRRRSAYRDGCRTERRTIERVAQTVSRRPAVMEVACRARHQDACIFEVRAGRRR